tara:strand:- start:19 stop:519 length:501 start_codon:yes stop_codon:yes gene_type:complete
MSFETYYTRFINSELDDCLAEINNMMISYRGLFQERLFGLLEDSNLKKRQKSIKVLSKFGPQILTDVVELYFEASSDFIKLSCIDVIIKVFINFEFDLYPESIFEMVSDSLSQKNSAFSLHILPLLKFLGIRGLGILQQLKKGENSLQSHLAKIIIEEINYKKRQI